MQCTILDWIMDLKETIIKDFFETIRKFEYILRIRYYDISVLNFFSTVMVLWLEKKVSIQHVLRMCMIKYLGLKCHDVCNLLSNGSAK